MSLYRYVASKDELLQLMWNASAQGAEDLVARGRRAGASDCAAGRWSSARCSTGTPGSPRCPWRRRRWRRTRWPSSSAGSETLDGTGLADADKLRVIGLISSYTLSEARMAHEAARAAAAGPRGRRARPAWTFERLLRELVDAEGYPRLHGIATCDDAASSGDRAADEQAEFLFGLETILDGVAAWSSAPRPAPARKPAPVRQEALAGVTSGQVVPARRPPPRPSRPRRASARCSATPG